jgi:hypothetical protein
MNLFVMMLWLSAISLAQTFQATPINDLGAGYYLGQFQGGLYENGTNDIPADHAAAGASFTNVVDSQSKFVFLGIGMSDMLNAFLQLKNTVSIANPAMTLIEGAQGSQASCEWAYAYGTPAQNGCPLGPGSQLINPYDYVVTNLLAPLHCGTKGHQACFSVDDVFVVMYYDADSCRLGVRCVGLPSSNADAYTQEKYEGMMARTLKMRFPNVQLLLITSREYGGYATQNINPEPYAYENGFATKWLIQAQINQADRGGSIDPLAGDLSYSSAPWIEWAAYTWASSETSRNDGLVWCQGQLDPVCNGETDFMTTDNTHMSKYVGLNKWVGIEKPWLQQQTWFTGAF